MNILNASALRVPQFDDEVNVPRRANAPNSASRQNWGVCASAAIFRVYQSPLADSGDIHVGGLLKTFRYGLPQSLSQYYMIHTEKACQRFGDKDLRRARRPYLEVHQGPVLLVPDR